jgi:hypothetical protein
VNLVVAVQIGIEDDALEQKRDKREAVFLREPREEPVEINRVVPAV